MSAVQVTWRELRPLAAELFRCDFPGCGEQADTIHLIPWCDGDCKCALFACPRHDPGGYHFPVADFLGDRIDWDRHLLDKLEADERRRMVGGWFELAIRLEQLTRPVVHVDEPEPPAPASAPAEPAPTAPRRRRRRATPPRELAAGEAMTRYGQVALAALVDEIRAAAEHTRNNTLNKAAFRAGQLVAAGQIAEDVARAELEQAAVETGLPAREAKTTVRRAIADGIKQPARIEELS